MSAAGSSVAFLNAAATAPRFFLRTTFENLHLDQVVAGAACPVVGVSPTPSPTPSTCPSSLQEMLMAIQELGFQVTISTNKCCGSPKKKVILEPQTSSLEDVVPQYWGTKGGTCSFPTSRIVSNARAMLKIMFASFRVKFAFCRTSSSAGHASFPE